MAAACAQLKLRAIAAGEVFIAALEDGDLVQEAAAAKRLVHSIKNNDADALYAARASLRAERTTVRSNDAIEKKARLGLGQRFTTPGGGTAPTSVRANAINRTGRGEVTYHGCHGCRARAGR